VKSPLATFGQSIDTGPGPPIIVIDVTPFETTNAPIAGFKIEFGQVNLQSFKTSWVAHSEPVGGFVVSAPWCPIPPSLVVSP